MAQTFNIVAKIQLQGPANLRPVVSSIQQQLSGINARINLTVAPGASRSVSSLSGQFASLNATIKATSAAAAGAAGSLKGVNMSTGAATSVAALNAQLKLAQGSSKLLGKSIQGSTTAIDRFGERVGLAARYFLAFQAGAVVISKIQSAFSGAVAEALEFQKTMAGLSQVGASTREIGQISKQIGDLSKNLGVASKDLADTTIILKGAGLSADEMRAALEALAKTSLTPTFKSIQNTTEGLIALRQQFGASAGDFSKYLGTINTVARQFAAESEDLVEGIRRAGSAFKAASSDATSSEQSFQQFLAVFTSIRATTRESAESIATGLRTIFARLQSNRVIDNLKGLGVSLRYTGEEAALAGKNIEGQFVGAWEAVRRLQSAVKGVPTTDPRFSQIVNQIGGFRQISRVIPLLQQTTLQQKAYAAAQAGNNSLTEDAAKKQGIFLTRLTKVKEEFNDLVRTIGQSKSLQIFGNVILGLASSLIKLANALTPLIPLMTAFAAIKIGQSFKSLIPAVTRGITQPVTHKQMGGVVGGHGTGDIVPAMLEPGEFVINKRSAMQIGYSRLANPKSLLAASGRQRFAGGGRADRDRKRSILYSKLAAGFDPGDNAEPLSQYTGTRYVTYGNALRDNVYNRPDLRQEIQSVNETLHRAPSHGRRIAVYRGIKDQRVLGQTRPGEDFTENSMMSTSLDPEIAKDFAGGRKSGSLMKIVVPKGTPLPAIDRLASIEGEKEVLFPAKARLRYYGQKKGVHRFLLKGFGKINDPAGQDDDIPGGKLRRKKGGQVPALLEPGEYVYNADEAKKIGYSKLNKWNKGQWDQDATDDPRYQLAMKIRDNGGMDAMYADRRAQGGIIGSRRQKLYDSLADQFHPGEGEADIRSYSGTSYVRYNNALRHGAYSVIKHRGQAEKLLRASDMLNRTLHGAPRHTRPVVVHRGLERDDVFQGLKPGDVFSDKGFLSTSLDRDTARQFKGQSGALASITLPRGTPLAAIRNFSASPTENEILLPAGGRYLYRGMRRDRHRFVLQGFDPLNLDPGPVPEGYAAGGVVGRRRFAGGGELEDVGYTDTHVPIRKISPRRRALYDRLASQLNTGNTLDYLQAYTGTRFTNYTTALRNGPYKVARGTDPEERRQQAQKFLQDIDKVNRVLHGAPTHDRPVAVYRGIKDSEILEHLKPGDIFHDKSFLSTSFNADVAKHFARDEDVGAVSKIILPAGTPLPALRPLSKFKWEDEVLLPAGGRYKYHGMRRGQHRFALQGFDPLNLDPGNPPQRKAAGGSIEPAPEPNINDYARFLQPTLKKLVAQKLLHSAKPLSGRSREAFGQVNNLLLGGKYQSSDAHLIASGGQSEKFAEIFSPLQKFAEEQGVDLSQVKGNARGRAAAKQQAAALASIGQGTHNPAIESYREHFQSIEDERNLNTSYKAAHKDLKLSANPDSPVLLRQIRAFAVARRREIRAGATAPTSGQEVPVSSLEEIGLDRPAYQENPLLKEEERPPSKVRQISQEPADRGISDEEAKLLDIQQELLANHEQANRAAKKKAAQQLSIKAATKESYAISEDNPTKTTALGLRHKIRKQESPVPISTPIAPHPASPVLKEVETKHSSAHSNILSLLRNPANFYKPVTGQDVVDTLGISTGPMPELSRLENPFGPPTPKKTKTLFNKEIPSRGQLATALTGPLNRKLVGESQPPEQPPLPPDMFTLEGGNRHPHDPFGPGSHQEGLKFARDPNATITYPRGNNPEATRQLPLFGSEVEPTVPVSYPELSLKNTPESRRQERLKRAKRTTAEAIGLSQIGVDTRRGRGVRSRKAQAKLGTQDPFFVNTEEGRVAAAAAQRQSLNPLGTEREDLASLGRGNRGRTTTRAEYEQARAYARQGLLGSARSAVGYDPTQLAIDASGGPGPQLIQGATGPTELAAGRILNLQATAAARQPFVPPTREEQATRKKVRDQLELMRGIGTSKERSKSRQVSKADYQAARDYARGGLPLPPALARLAPLVKATTYEEPTQPQGGEYSYQARVRRAGRSGVAVRPAVAGTSLTPAAKAAGAARREIDETTAGTRSGSTRRGGGVGDCCDKLTDLLKQIRDAIKQQTTTTTKQVAAAAATATKPTATAATRPSAPTSQRAADVIAQARASGPAGAPPRPTAEAYKAEQARKKYDAYAASETAAGRVPRPYTGPEVPLPPSTKQITPVGTGPQAPFGELDENIQQKRSERLVSEDIKFGARANRVDLTAVGPDLADYEADARRDQAKAKRRGDAGTLHSESRDFSTPGRDLAHQQEALRRLFGQQLSEVRPGGKRLSSAEISRRTERVVAEASKRGNTHAVVAGLVNRQTAQETRQQVGDLTSQFSGITGKDDESEAQRQDILKQIAEVNASRESRTRSRIQANTEPSSVRRELEAHFNEQIQKQGVQRRKQALKGGASLTPEEGILYGTSADSLTAQKIKARDLAQQAIEGGHRINGGIFSEDIASVTAPSEGGRFKRAVTKTGRGIGRFASRANAAGKSLGGRVGSVGFGVAASFAPTALESVFGTVDNPTDPHSRETAARAHAVGGGLQGAAIGAQAGILLGPLGAAAGAAAGGIYGFVTSLKEANNRIKELDFEKSFRGFEAALDDIANNRKVYDPKARGQVASGLGAVQEEARRSVQANGVGNFFDRHLRGTLVGNIIDDRESGRPIYSHSDEELYRLSAKHQSDKRTELLTPKLPELHQIGQNIANNLKVEPKDLASSANASESEIQAGRQARLQKFNAAGGGQIAQTIADIQKIPLEQVYESFDQIIKSSNLLRIQTGAETKAVTAATIQLHQFTQIEQAVNAAASSLHGLQVESEHLSNLFQGTTPTSRVGNFSEAAGQIGHVDQQSFQNSLTFAASNLGGTNSQELTGLLHEVDAAMRNLPAAISSANLNFSDPEALKGGLTGVLGGGRGNLGLPEEIQSRLGTAIEAMDPEHLFKDITSNPHKLVEDLVKGAFGDLTQVMENVTKGLEDRFNRFGAGLTQYTQLILKQGESVDRVSAGRLDSQRASATLRAARTGRDASDFLSLGDLRQPIVQRQTRLAGADAFNPAGIADRLDRANTSILDTQKQLNNPSQVTQDEVFKLGPDRAAEENIRRTEALQTKFSNVSTEASKLQQALEHLANASDETAAIQEKLNEIEKQRQGQLSFTEKLLTANPEQLRDIHRNASLSDVAARQGSFAGFNEEGISRVLEHLRSLQDVKLPGYGNRTGGQVADRLLGQANRLVFGKGATDLDQGRQNLLQKQVDAQNVAVEAQQKIANTQAKTADAFIGNLKAQNSEFISKLDRLISEARLRDAQGVQERAKVGVQQAQAAVAGVTRVEQVTRGPSGEQLPVAKIRGIINDPQFANFRLARSQANVLGRRGASIGGELGEELAKRGTLFGGKFDQIGAADDKQTAIDRLSAQLPKIRQTAIQQTGLSPEDVDKSHAGLIGRVSKYFDIPIQKRPQAFDVNKELIDVTKGGLDAARREAIDRETVAGRQVGINAFGGDIGDKQPAQNVLGTLAANFETVNTAIANLPQGLDSATQAAENLARSQATLASADKGVIAAQPKAAGGIMFRSRGTDTVPAMLSPGEYVVNAAATRANLPLLQQINAVRGPAYFEDGGEVDLSVLSPAIQGNAKIPLAIKKKMALAQVAANKRQEDSAEFGAYLSTQVDTEKADREAKGRAQVAQGADYAARRAEKQRQTLQNIGIDQSGPVSVVQQASGISDQNKSYFNYFDKAIDYYQGTHQGNITPTSIRAAARNRQQLEHKVVLLQKTGGSQESIERGQAILEKLEGSKIGQSLTAANAARRAGNLGDIGDPRGPHRIGVANPRNASSMRASLASRSRAARGRKAASREVSRYKKSHPYFEGGGLVPAMLTPGEFVVNADSAKSNQNLLNHLNSGRSPLYRAAGGSVGGTSGSAGSGQPAIELGGSVKTTLDGFVSGFGNAAQSLAEPIGRLQSAAETFGGVGKSLDGFATSANALAEGMSGFNDAATSLAKALGGVNIPPKIEMTMNGNYNVVLNGGNMFATMQKAVAEQVKQEILQQLGGQIQKAIAEAPPR